MPVGKRCLNKQFDLQTVFMEDGREIYPAGGWYEPCRLIEPGFVCIVMAGAAGSGIWPSRRHHAFFRTSRCLGLGRLSLLTLILVRAVAVHHIDEPLHTGLPPLPGQLDPRTWAISRIVFAAMRK